MLLNLLSSDFMETLLVQEFGLERGWHTSGAKELLRALCSGLGEPYGFLGIEPGLAKCTEGVLFPILSFLALLQYFVG